MKKLATLLLAAGMVVASTAPANAVDVKVDARFRTSFAVGEKSFKGSNSEDFQHRLRLGLTMAASENLSAYTQFQFGGYQWGTTNKHGMAASGNGDKITARMLYLDWTVPGTAVKVRMGRHQFGLPAEAFGTNSILAAGYGNREGVVVTAPVTDWLGLTGMWARLGTDGTELDQSNNTDMFALAANLKFDGFSGSVYAAYAATDAYEKTSDSFKYKAADAADVDAKGYVTLDGTYTAAAGGKPAMCYGMPNVEGDAYWVGFTSTFSAFDPFTLKVSAAYGGFDARNNGEDNQNGWNVQAKAAYALPFGTATLGGWYFSGAEKDNAGMPHSGYFAGTNYYFDGFAALNSNNGNTTIDGQWAVQAGIEGVSFIEGLSHSLQVTYMEGTNDKEVSGKQLTEDDNLVEISMTNTYKMYKNLAVHLELGYLISDFDDTKTGGKYAGMTEDDWFAGLTFDFKF